MAVTPAALRTIQGGGFLWMRLVCGVATGAAFSVAWSGVARAQNASAAPPAASAPAAAKTIELRAAVSPPASAFFPEPRLRRLLQLELQGTAVLADSLAGPPGDQVAWLWIDLPDKTTARIEVRMASGLSARRLISIDNLGTDPAARHVALAAAEMVRSLAQPLRVRKPPAAKHPCCEQAEHLMRSMPALALSAGAGATVLTGEPVTMFGPWLGLGLQYQHAGARVVARWNGGWPAFGSLSWLEAGLAADYRFSLHPAWRVRVGAVATAASVRLGGASTVDGSSGSQSSWSARAGASIGLETRVGDTSWVSLSAEPGAILRPVGFEDHDGGAHHLSGAWLGFDLALHLERRR
jgi:hypothetical protein